MNNMIPIPTHLKNILVPKGEENDEFFVTGEIVCECGNKEFDISYIGNYEDGIVTLCEFEGVFYLAIKCECKKCGKVHLIFDDNFHGWNGFVCSEENRFKGYENFPIDEFEKSWECPECSNQNHELVVSISSEGKDDFISELIENHDNPKFVEDDWVNGFSWITIGTKCTKCGHEDKDWINYETM